MHYETAVSATSALSGFEPAAPRSEAPPLAPQVAAEATEAKPGSVPVRLPDAFTINFGDAPGLAEFCLRADQAFAAAGIDLYVSGNLGLLKEINARNRDSWFPLFPSFDVSFGGITPETSYFIYGVERSSGDVVATVAGRLFLIPRSLTETCGSLELFYGDPKRQAEPGERAYYTGAAAAAADMIKGRVVMSGCGWFMPNRARGRGFSRILPRLSRAYARARWGTDFTISTVRAHHVAGGVAAAYGYTNVAEAFEWTSSWNARSGASAGAVALVWMDADELESDLAAWNAESRRRDAGSGMSEAAD